MLDVAVRNGWVVDGSGGPRTRADVGISEGRIVAVGEVGDAHRTIDADGRVVAPGFIDVHTHLDAQAFWDPMLSPSPLHGVTTAIAGNCGFSIAPLGDADDARYLMEMLARVEGMPLGALETGVPWDWSSTGEYLSRLDGTLAVNLGFMVGHSAVRRRVMGVAATQRTASDAELAAMCELLRAGLAAGGFGFSSTWSTAHNDGVGDPVPSRWADGRELIALAGVCAEFPGTSLEFLPKSPPRQPLDEESLGVMIGMSRAAGRPLNWNLMRVNAANRHTPEIEGRLECGSRALEEGARIIALVMPEPFVIHLSFANGVQLDTITGWRKPMALPITEKIAYLSDPVRRAELAELARSETLRREYTDWGGYEITEVFSEENRRFEGRLIADIARELGTDPFDTLLDICLRDGLRTYFRQPIPPQSQADWEARAEVCRDRRVLIGGSDAGAHLDQIGTHKYATDVLATLVRTHGVLGLEEAVALLTSAPAEAYGLRERGRIAPGCAADIVVFDPQTVCSAPLRTRFDLPGGAGRLYAEAVGVDHVLVNGTPIASGGEFTGETPGRVLRAGRDTIDPPMV